MKALAGLILLSLALAGARTSVSAQNLPEALAENFYSPALVRMAQPALSLSPEQTSALKEAVEKVEPSVAELRSRLERENGLLLAMVKAEKLDPEAVMVQGDKVLHLQEEIQRSTLALLLKIRETLTPEQQAKLRQFKAKTAGLQTRVRQAMDLAQKWKQEGRDLSTFEQARQQFEALMASGDFNAAEALLDKTLQALKAPPPQPKN